MNRPSLLAALVLLPSLVTLGHPTDLALRKIDCEQILQRWAEDPNTVPRDIVERCRAKLQSGVLAHVRNDKAVKNLPFYS